MNTKDIIEQILKDTFKISSLEVIDDSAKHAGHKAAIESGGGHFTVNIISDDFKDKKLIERHRMINSALKEELKTTIHALAIKTHTPSEMS
ncbi:MAG: BolA protein [Candidatus Omnitrophota bacterium]|jgi:BolA protein